MVSSPLPVDTRARIGIVGSNLASLVAARELAAAGRDVELIAPQRRLGGIFAGQRFEDAEFDAGTILLELTDYSASDRAQLETYDPLRRNDCGRFVGHVASYLRELGVEVREIDLPVMSLDGITLPDVILSNQVQALAALPEPLRKAMHAELQAIVSSPQSPLHASQKKERPADGWPSLEVSSLANHGRTFHETFIEPLCRKIAGVGSDQILAIHHRSLWLPLYYPETLLVALEGHSPALPETRFSYPRHGSIATITATLERDVRAHPRVHITHARVDRVASTNGGYALALEDGTAIAVQELAWGDPLDALLGHTSTFDKAGITVVYLMLDRDALANRATCTYILDDDLQPFRITNLSACAGDETGDVRMIVELGATASASTEQSAIDALTRLGFIRDADAIRARMTRSYPSALLLPSRSNHERFDREHAQARAAFPNVHLLGAAAGFAATGINDQIVQGLQLAQRVRGS